MADLERLVEAARAGDGEAFTELVRLHQEMAFGYAYSVLGDFHLAQDAAQDAFVAACAGLDHLRDPARFPAWLRGIVRHQCFRILRRRERADISLDREPDGAAARAGAGIETVADAGPGPEDYTEQRAGLEAVLRLMRSLPEPLRDVTVLYYVREHSQREIAAFLELPVTTVNNRLHAARTRLRGGLETMAKDALRTNGLPEDFAEQVGRIVGARGPVLEARFAEGNVPAILSALTVADGGAEGESAAGVVEHLGGGTVRCLVLSPGGQLGEGARVRSIGAPVNAVPDAETVRAMVASVPAPASPPSLLETGIKAVDLLCPLPAGGRVAFVGRSGVGKIVLAGELVQRLEGSAESLSIFLPTIEGYDVRLTWEGFGADNPPDRSDRVRSIYFPAAKEPPDAIANLFDAAVFLSYDLAIAGIYPAVDTLRSRSRLLTPEVVGREHYDVARSVRALLWRAEEIEGRTFDAADMTGEEQLTVARARRVRRFLGQPMLVAEPWTGQPGRSVPRERSVRDFAALLSGEHDDLPEDAFSMVGDLEEAIEKSSGMGQ